MGRSAGGTIVFVGGTWRRMRVLTCGWTRQRIPGDERARVTRSLGKRFLLPLVALLALNVSDVHASLPLDSLALRVNNLRPGYVVITSAYRTEAFVAQRYHVSLGRLNYNGWVASYEALYARKDRAGLGEVGNKIDRYSSPVGAHWGYRLAMQTTLCCGKYGPIAMPRVGDESTGFLAVSGGRGFIGIKFRQGDYVADVAVLPGTKRASLLLLARLVDARIRLYG